MKQFCITVAYILLCKFIMVTITRHIFIYIFQTEHFWAFKVAMGNEKNISGFFCLFVCFCYLFLFLFCFVLFFWYQNLQNLKRYDWALLILRLKWIRKIKGSTWRLCLNHIPFFSYLTITLSSLNTFLYFKGFYLDAFCP